MMPGLRVACAMALALSLGLTTASGPALAQEAPSKAAVEEAKRRFQRGRELYEDNDFQGALVEIRRAYELAPTYRLLYDIGLINAQLKDYPGALQNFQRFLQEGKGDVSPQQREEVQREIEKLTGRVATLRITANQQQAEIAIDDIPMGKTPLAEPVLVSAGRRKVTATLKGYVPATQTVEVAGQETLDISLDLAKVGPGGEATLGGEQAGAPDRPEKQEPDAGPPSYTPAVVMWTVTGLCAISAGVTGGLALGASSDLTTGLETFGTTRDALDSQRSKAQGLALASDILLAATAVSAGVSVYLTVRAASGGGAAPRSGSAGSVRVGVGPGSVSVAGTF